MKQILLVEDDRTLNRMVSGLLSAEGYLVTSAYTAGDTYMLLAANSYDLSILDVNLPDGTGWDICREIQQKSDTAVIFITANDLEQDMVKGYRLGAADYITKPFSNQILRHKVNAIFSLLDRAAKEPGHKVYSDGRLSIDFSSLNASICGREVIFSPLEYRIIEVFTLNKGILLTRGKLLEELWDSQDNYVAEHTLTAAISRIRGKIEQDGIKYIQTVYGMGYMFTEGVKK